jgi:hypothetical protein
VLALRLHGDQSFHEDWAMTQPPLPTGHTIGCGIFNGQKLFIADQMRAYAGQAVAAERAEIERLRAGMGALIRERRGAESIREGLQSLMRGGPNDRVQARP